MKNLVIGFCFAAIGLAPLAGSAEEALFWRFDDPTVVRYHGDPISAHEIEGVNAIRVKAVDGGVESYLRLYAGDGTGFADLGDALAGSVRLTRGESAAAPDNPHIRATEAEIDSGRAD